VAGQHAAPDRRAEARRRGSGTPRIPSSPSKGAYNLALAVVLLRAVWTPGSPARPGLRSLVPRWRYASQILRVSVPSAARTLLTNLTFILLTALVAPFGTEATADSGAAGRLEYPLNPHRVRRRLGAGPARRRQ
jgi:hypothetical protein